jgi:hypothetical protein
MKNMEIHIKDMEKKENIISPITKETKKEEIIENLLIAQYKLISNNLLSHILKEMIDIIKRGMIKDIKTKIIKKEK